MSIDFAGLLSKLICKEVHEISHEVALSHEQVFSNSCAMSLKLELSEEDLDQSIVSDLVSVIDPIIQFLKSLRCLA